MSTDESLQGRYRSHVTDLAGALDANDEAAFRAAFERLRAQLNVEMNPELKRITSDALSALRRFREQARLEVLADQEVPDARRRLAHVVKLTEEAAHRTLDLVEQSGPLAERTGKEAGQLLERLAAYKKATNGAQGLEASIKAIDAFLPLMKSVEQFLPAARADSENIRRNLADVLLAQGYQDLTGQIIRSVMKLVEELEAALDSLAALSGDVVEHASMGETEASRQGPVVPGVTKGDVASGQTDVDALLSGLGM